MNAQANVFEIIELHLTSRTAIFYAVENIVKGLLKTSFRRPRRGLRCIQSRSSEKLKIFMLKV